MPQFDFYVFGSLPALFAATAAVLVFVTLLFGAISAWAGAQVVLLFKAHLVNKTLMLARAAHVVAASADLLEQFIMPGAAAATTNFLVIIAAIAAIFTCASHFSKAAIYFVGSIGIDVYAGGRAVFSRSWLNFSIIFFCTLIYNLVGILPFAFTFTGSLAVPFAGSLTIFFTCLYTAVLRGGLRATAGFLPAGTERAIAPLIILIEIVSTLAKFISLGVRLFANMFAGHLLLKVFYSISFQVVASITFFFALPEIFAAIFVFFVIALEIMIAFLQAFVFVLLGILYVKEAENFIGAH